jgi:ketopantoate reductase
LVFGEYGARKSARGEAFLAACQTADIDAELSDAIEQLIWEKFVFLVGLSGMTSKFGTPIGPIQENPEKRAMLFETMREVVAVGRAKGVPLRPDFAEDRLAFCDPGEDDIVDAGRSQVGQILLHAVDRAVARADRGGIERRAGRATTDSPRP